MAKFHIDIKEVYKATYTVEAESYEEAWKIINTEGSDLDFQSGSWHSWLDGSVVYIENVEEQGARTYVIGKD